MLLEKHFALTPFSFLESNQETAQVTQGKKWEGCPCHTNWLGIGSEWQ